MANYTKKNVSTKTTVTENEKSIAEVVETLEEKVSEVKVRTFEQEDLIPCRSIVSGQLFIEGVRSKLLYRWADYGDVVDVEYRDLIYMVRSSGDVNMYQPRIIVEDEDFISQNGKLKEFYDSMYTVDDLREIINAPVNQLKEIINNLPVGCRDSVRDLAVTMIDEKRLDSVSRIKALDEIFGTQMMLTLSED